MDPVQLLVALVGFFCSLPDDVREYSAPFFCDLQCQVYGMIPEEIKAEAMAKHGPTVAAATADRPVRDKAAHQPGRPAPARGR